MIVIRPLTRIAGSIAVAGVCSAVGGAVLGYLYERLDVPVTFPMPGLDEFASAVYLGVFGLVLGVVVGITRLGLLSATIVGFALGVVFDVRWLATIPNPREPDKVMMVGAVSVLTVVGLLTAIACRALSLGEERSL